MRTTARTLAFGFAALAGGLLGPSVAAFAQIVNPTPQVNPSGNLAAPEPQPPISPNVEHLFGDWGGLRTYLEKYGVKASSGGGRSSARETIGRVAAGAIAEKYLRLAYGVEIVAFVMYRSRPAVQTRLAVAYVEAAAAAIAIVATGASNSPMLPYLLTIAEHGVENALEECPELARGVYTLRGRRP